MSVIKYIEFIGNTIIAGFGGSGTSNIQSPFPRMSRQTDYGTEYTIWIEMQKL
jgi:hypothetical protein